MKKSHELTQKNIELFKELRGGALGLRMLARTTADKQAVALLENMTEKAIGALEAIRDAQREEGQ